MSSLFIGEKPSFSRQVIEFAPSNTKAEIEYQVDILPYQTIRFHYPRSIKYADIPFIGAPAYKLNPGVRISRWEDGVSQKIDKDIKSVLSLIKSADNVYIATDPDHTGELAANIWVNQSGRNGPVKRLSILDLSDSSISLSWGNLSNFISDGSNKRLSYGSLKRYFEYNFNINSHVVFGDILRSEGVDTNNFTLSKYQLLLLHLIRRGASKNINSLLCFMANYTGTGKYPPMSIAGPASQAELINQLESVSLINSNAQLTEVGLSFLSRTHKKTFDPDLPARLDNWCKQSDVVNAEHEMNRYLRTLFGKQSRYKSC